MLRKVELGEMLSSSELSRLHNLSFFWPNYEMLRLSVPVSDPLISALQGHYGDAALSAAFLGFIPVEKVPASVSQALRRASTARAEVGRHLARNDDIVATAYFRQERQFWSQEPVQFSGNKVYQRNDLIDPYFVDSRTGKTNLELMQLGRAPVGPDGKPINLHHMLQSQDGPIAEVTQSFHQANYSSIHINSNSRIQSGINRSAFDRWRESYWKERAKDFGK